MNVKIYDCCIQTLRQEMPDDNDCLKCKCGTLWNKMHDYVNGEEYWLVYGQRWVHGLKVGGKID